MTNYYDQNAQRFFDDTVSVDLTSLHNVFLKHVPKGGVILDAGCGSGRDGKVFLDQGYRVVAFDASAQLAALASEYMGQPVAHRRFNDVHERSVYDGVWACASLLHVPMADLPSSLSCLWDALKSGGVIYLSFKVGFGEHTRSGRRFTDLDESNLRGLVDGLEGVSDFEFWRTEDQRPNRREIWLNGLIHKGRGRVNKLISGGEEDPFLPELLSGIHQATEIDMAVAFIKTTGLRLLFASLKEAIAQSEESNTPPASLRIITSDYLDVTDPEALRLLMLLQERGAQIRVFESAERAFHMKAYIFIHCLPGVSPRGTAYIGSSNISQQALKSGLEWNYRIVADHEVGDMREFAGFNEIRSRFEKLFADPATRALSYGWIEEYEQRRRPSSLPIAPGSDEKEPPPKPNEAQQAALTALSKTREEGYRRGLVVMATGLGKTWLAAFDTMQMGSSRVLFVAHREEILSQAEETFLRIRPGARTGYYTGQTKDFHEAVDVLCASVQTLGKLERLKQFSPRHFSYIVVDEFHHASANTYRRILAHFEPQFLLGLTATPDRTDQSDILSLCDDNLVYSNDLFDGIQSRLLSPFHYYGIHDDQVDYQAIPWRSGRFDPKSLTHCLATLARARHVWKEWKKHGRRRCLAFCASMRHADFMAEKFSDEGVLAAAVHGSSPLSRGEALERLANGQLQVIFSVDLFNEGLDLPEIDTVMLLRPTESKILFLQQIGRGLRKSDKKDNLLILDFIGNHKAFFHKFQALFKDVGQGNARLAEFARLYDAGELVLPDGCYVNYDLKLIDFLKHLDTGGREKDYLDLRDNLGRRPTLTEFYRSGASVQAVRKDFGNWFAFVERMEDLTETESNCVKQHGAFFREVEISQMNKSFKMILLEALMELDGFVNPPKLDRLAEKSLELFQRRRNFASDIDLHDGDSKKIGANEWLAYWRKNPVRAWIGKRWFRVENGKFCPAFWIADNERETFHSLLQELIDHRLAAYEARPTNQNISADQTDASHSQTEWVREELPYFPDLKIACGHFRSGNIGSEEYRVLSPRYGKLDPARHFIARASGHSMNGGDGPIRDGDYLLMECITPGSSEWGLDPVMAVEREHDGNAQYLLRQVIQKENGKSILRAFNPEYADIDLGDGMKAFARLKEVLEPLTVGIGRTFQRE